MDRTRSARRRIAIALLLSLLALVGCDSWDIRRLHIYDAEKLVFGRHGRHHVVNGCELYMLERPDGTPPEETYKTLWLIYSPRYLVWEDFRITYGELPLHFQQVYPPEGSAPEPLREGAVYGLVANWWEKIGICRGGWWTTPAHPEMFKFLMVTFRIQDGRAVAVKAPLIID